MTTIHVATEITAPPERVWADLRNIASHVEWMHDAASITFTSPTTSGVGTTFDCLTTVGPFRLVDAMTVTSWIENTEMGVRHDGLVTGEGKFTLSSIGDGHTRFAWTETLHFPWWLGGPIGEFVGKFVLGAIWRRNLQGLAARFS